MNKSESEAITVHRKVKQSTTLNRKYVKRPTKNNSDIKNPTIAKKINILDTSIAKKDDQMNKKAAERLASANAKLRAMKVTPKAPKKLTPKELKDQAIAKALKEAAKNEESSKSLKTKSFSTGRIIFALSCAAVFVFFVTYFVNNTSNFSFHVNAMQSGIEAKYPKFLPSGYSLSGVTTENNQVIINFENSSANQTFTLIEKQTSWDINAFVENYISQNFENDYSISQKNEISVYITSTQAAWIKDNILYKLTYQSGTLAKNQITSIATSL